jgi:8-oxo-dGTP diphosphatase
MVSLPIFGNRVEGRTYVRRPSAYALIQNDDDELAVVRTPQGYFLPGGGMDPGETPEQTVEREAREECGFIVRPRAVVGRAVQFVYSFEEEEYFEKICEFVEAELIGATDKSEDDHELHWLSIAQALDSLSHESHRWALDHFSRRES